MFCLMIAAASSRPHFDVNADIVVFDGGGGQNRARLVGAGFGIAHAAGDAA